MTLPNSYGPLVLDYLADCVLGQNFVHPPPLPKAQRSIVLATDGQHGQHEEVNDRQRHVKKRVPFHRMCMQRKLNLAGIAQHGKIRRYGCVRQST